MKLLPQIGLVGAGKLICDFIRLLSNKGFPKPIVFTHKKALHKRDQILLKGTKNYKNIFDFCSENNIQLFELENINDSSSISLLKSEKISYLISISARWIFGDELIRRFGSNLLNIHHGDLPSERGSTTASHRIMNGKNSAGVTMHIIEKGIDSGPILYKENEAISNERPTHDDMNDLHTKLSLHVVNRFINDLISQKPLKPISQNQFDSFYLPQLYTELNGAINWSWTADQIDKFVRAFGQPFPGAYTFYGEKKSKFFLVIQNQSIMNSIRSIMVELLEKMRMKKQKLLHQRDYL